MPKRSINARNVALDVLETVGSGERVNLGDIIERNGYSKGTSLTPCRVTETISYKEVMEPILKQMEQERQRILTAIMSKDLSEDKHKDLVGSMDVMTKNIQLLGGGVTENVGVTIRPINYGDSDSTSIQT